MTVEVAIARIREFAQRRGLSKGQLARAAGLRDTVLRSFDSDNWNPTVATVRKLEGLLAAETEVLEQPSNGRSFR